MNSSLIIHQDITTRIQLPSATPALKKSEPDDKLSGEPIFNPFCTKGECRNDLPPAHRARSYPNPYAFATEFFYPTDCVHSIPQRIDDFQRNPAQYRRLRIPASTSEPESVPTTQEAAKNQNDRPCHPAHRVQNPARVFAGANQQHNGIGRRRPH